MNKKSFYAIALAIGAIAASALTYNYTYRPRSAFLTILADKTDTFLVKPEGAAARQVFSDNGLWDSYSFRLAAISDLDFTPVYEKDLPAAWFVMGVVYDRDSERTEFFNALDSEITRANNDPVGKPRSAVYYPLARELEKLAASKADKRVLILYSDGMENTGSVNFYDPKTLKRLKEKPEEMRALFEKQYPLPSLAGIEVHMVFQPKNFLENANFLIVSKWYSDFLTGKGASVTVSANLNL